jgi:hypothetical protein
MAKQITLFLLLATLISCKKNISNRPTDQIDGTASAYLNGHLWLANIRASYTESDTCFDRRFSLSIAHRSFFSAPILP